MTALLDSCPALVLNADFRPLSYFPLSLWSWQDAVKAVFLDRVNIGFAKQDFQAHAGISAAAYALGAGLFFVGYAIFEVPSNLALEKFGASRWIARIMVTWGIISAAMASTSERAIMLLEYLFVTRTISASGSDSCVSRSRAAGGVGARSIPPRNWPPSWRQRVTKVPYA